MSNISSTNFMSLGNSSSKLGGVDGSAIDMFVVFGCWIIGGKGGNGILWIENFDAIAVSRTLSVEESPWN